MKKKIIKKSIPDQPIFEGKAKKKTNKKTHGKVTTTHHLTSQFLPHCTSWISYTWIHPNSIMIWKSQPSTIASTTHALISAQAILREIILLLY